MSSSVWGNEKTEFFNTLTPDKVLDAIESLGLKSTGRVMQLTSMENRVYEVEIENPAAKSISENFVIIKFYRPGRWSKNQILDEHQFLFDLIENDIPAIAPNKYEGQSLFEDKDSLYFTVFPKQGGRACDEWNDELLTLMGRLLARVHNTGLIRAANHRLRLDIETFGEKNLELILNSKQIPFEYEKKYIESASAIFKESKRLFEGIKYQRVHGDCHHGNILLKEGLPFLIDFDDMSIAPRVQDLWMIIPGRDDYSLRQRDILLNSYLEMSDFDFKELKLIEPLRSLRIIHFSAWIGHRYEDFAFKRTFPDFGTSQYWEKEIYDLNNQLELISKI